MQDAASASGASPITSALRVRRRTLRRLLSFEGLIGSSRRNERQRQQMRGDAEAKIDGTAVAHAGLAALQIDLDVMVLEESPVERVHRFICRLLRDEQQSAAEANIGDHR